MNRIALQAAKPGHEPAPPVDAWSRLSELRCPVLVVVGDLDLAHIPPTLRWLASEIPGAHLTVMEGAAHLPGFEQPTAFASLLRTFFGLYLARNPRLRAPSLIWSDVLAALRRRTDQHGRGRPVGQRRAGVRRARRRRSGRGRHLHPARAGHSRLSARGPSPQAGLRGRQRTALEKVAAATGHCAVVVGFVGAAPCGPGCPMPPPSVLAAASSGLQQALPAQLRRLRRAALVRAERRRRPSSGWPGPGWISICEDVWFSDGPVPRPAGPGQTSW